MNRVERLIFAQENAVDWVPPTKGRNDRWSALLRVNNDPLPWRYLNREYRRGGWSQFQGDEGYLLEEYAKVLATELPQELWVACVRDTSPNWERVGCFDLRLLNFSPSSFNRKEVIEAIASTAKTAQQAILSKSGPLRRPTSLAEIGFETHQVAGVQFSIAWYPYTDWIRWPLDDSLRPVTRIQQTSGKFDGVQKAADAFRELVLAAVPSVPLAEAALPDAQPKRGRPITQRRAVREGFEEVWNASDAVLTIVGDIATAVVQKTVDGMCGQAFAALADNKSFTDKLLSTCQQFGIRLYFESGADLLQVRIRAVPAPGTQKTNSATPAALAGAFNVSVYQSEHGGSVGITNLALFPSLIAARNLEEAQRILAERKKLSSGQ